MNKILISIIKKIGWFILPKNEKECLFAKYHKIPRFEKGVVKFRNYSFKTPDVPSILWQIKENFIDNQLNFKSDTTSPVVIDCGANIGITCAYFKHIYPHAKIKAYEADPNIFKYLKKNIENNKLEKNIELINKARWTDNNGIEFSIEGADGGSIYTKTSQKIKVESIRLREILRLEEIVDLLKIDIEGAEDVTIVDCGELLKKVNYIFIEYHSFINRRQNLDLILKTLSDNDFKYQIKSDSNESPFVKENTDYCELDMQLLIFAINTKK